MSQMTPKRPIVVDVDHAAVGDDSRPWWQTIRIDEFRSRVESMSTHELDAISTEIKAALAGIQGEIEGTRETRGEQWFHRANWKRLRLAERKGIVTGVLTRRHEAVYGLRKERRAGLLSEAKARLAEDDLRGAVAKIVEILSLSGDGSGLPTDGPTLAIEPVDAPPEAK